MLYTPEEIGLLQAILDATSGSGQEVQIVDADGDSLSVNNPLPTDGNSAHQNDIWVEQSTSTNFSGTVIDLFDNLHSAITNITSEDPKTLLIHFNRTVVSNAVGLGAVSGNFSNTKIEIGNSGEVFTTVIDESAIGTKYTSRTFQLPITAGFNALRLTFHTADTITLSNCFILKAQSVVARLQAAKPDNTITDINATTGGNLKVSFEEIDGALLADDRLMVESTIVGQQNSNRHAWLSALGDIVVSPRYRLVGHSFSGTTKDTHYWDETGTANGGTVAQSGGTLDLETNTTANGTAMYFTTEKARFVAGSPMVFTGLVNWETAGTADNVRRVGAYNTTNGFFCELDGTTFSLGTRKDSVDTLYTAFNGNMGATWTPTADTDYKIGIEFLPVGVHWYVNDVLLHKIGASNLSDTLTLPVKIENVNDNSQDTDVKFHAHAMLIERQGQASTSPTSLRQSGITAGVVCKYGAGTLRGIVVSAIVNGADINIYDGTSNAGTLIWASGNQAARTDPFNIDFYGLPFGDGLTLEIADSSADVIVIYE